MFIEMKNIAKEWAMSTYLCCWTLGSVLRVEKCIYKSAFPKLSSLEKKTL